MNRKEIMTWAFMVGALLGVIGIGFFMGWWSNQAPPREYKVESFCSAFGMPEGTSLEVNAKRVNDLAKERWDYRGILANEPRGCLEILFSRTKE